MQRGTRNLGVLLALVLSTSLTEGCGSEKDQAGAETPESHVGEKANALIKAEQGGELAVGAVKLTVVPSSLDADTELSIEVVEKQDFPASKDIALDVYKFGPEGLQFKAPAELEFDISKVDVPKDKRVDVAVLEKGENVWKALPPTPMPAQGKLSTKIAHFSYYTVIFSPKDAPAPGSCGADFTSCGGDLTGTWNFQTGCITAPPAALGASVPPEFDACSVKPGALVAIDVTGNVMFGADSRFSLAQSVTLNPSLQIPQSCLDELSATRGMPVSCAEFSGTMTGDVCVRNLTPETTPSSSRGSYTTSGGSLMQMEDGVEPEPEKVTSYCVTGDTLTIRIERPSEQRVDVYTATRAL